MSIQHVQVNGESLLADTITFRVKRMAYTEKCVDEMLIAFAKAHDKVTLKELKQ